MERILDDNQPVEQAGFRKNFSCIDQIQTVAQLIERSREYHIPHVLVFVDYRKTFDSVEINAVLNALVHAGVPSPYVQLLDECFSITSTTIQLFDRKLTIPIEKEGYPVDGERNSNLRFADDIVFIPNSTAEAEEMLRELNMAGLVKLNVVALQRVDSYVYLVGELNMENDLAPEIARVRRAA
ncbi:hypothetical protein Q1695_014670 [Nippostrongylus brasiliensis]|nr:hypothetical protein Q1695_014670 [Nippostrongylus brasiliensis]